MKLDNYFSAKNTVFRLREEYILKYIEYVVWYIKASFHLVDFARAGRIRLILRMCTLILLISSESCEVGSSIELNFFGGRFRPVRAKSIKWKPAFRDVECEHVNPWTC